MNVGIITQFKKGKYLEGLVFITISIIFLNIFGLNLKPRLGGDGEEYLLMQESFYNHASPDLRPLDIESAKLVIKSTGDTSANYYLKWISWYMQTNPKPLTSSWAYYRAYNMKYYCYHFWAYSFFCVPVRCFLHLIGGNLLKSFTITNVLLMLIIIAYILFLSGISKMKKWLAFVFYLLSFNIAFLTFSGAESFSFSLFYLSFILFIDKKYLWAIVVCGIASMQNLPILLTIPFFVLKFLTVKGFNFKNILLSFLASIVASIQIVFYFYYFHVPNLIVFAGASHKENINLDRLHSLFFDLNQGMIVALPFILPCFICLYLWNIFHFKKQNWFGFLIPLIMIAMGLLTCVQGRWNSCFAITRYVLWLSVPIYYYLIEEILWTSKVKKAVLGLMVVSLITAQQLNGWHKPYCSFTQFNELSTFILDKYPSLYNPDPGIFYERTTHIVNDKLPDKTPVIYYNKKGKATKAMINKVYADSLKGLPGMDSIALREKLKHIHYIHSDKGYRGYINLR